MSRHGVRSRGKDKRQRLTTDGRARRRGRGTHQKPPPATSRQISVEPVSPCGVANGGWRPGLPPCPCLPRGSYRGVIGRSSGGCQIMDVMAMGAPRHRCTRIAYPGTRPGSWQPARGIKPNRGCAARRALRPYKEEPPQDGTWPGTPVVTISRLLGHCSTFAAANVAFW